MVASEKWDNIGGRLMGLCFVLMDEDMGKFGFGLRFLLTKSILTFDFGFWFEKFSVV